MNRLAIIALILTATLGCTRGHESAPPAKAKADKPAITNRIDVPATVRRNLGITFAKVERRHVASVIRVPGQFEFQPKAKREHHTTLSGRVELLVDQYQQVEPDTPLYHIDSPQWRQVQQELANTIQSIRAAHKRRAVLKKRETAESLHADRLRQEAAIWEGRIKQIDTLIKAGGGAASAMTEARAQMATTQTSLAQVEEEMSETEQHRVELETQLEGFERSTPLLYADAMKQPAPQNASKDLALSRASSLMGISVDELRRNVGTENEPTPYWRTIDQVEVKSTSSGVVQMLAATNGGWLDSGALVLTTVNPKSLRFRAVGLQSSLSKLRNGMRVAIIPPRGSAGSLKGSIPGELNISLEADPHERKIDLIANPEPEALTEWALPGVAAEMEIAIDESATKVMAIPANAVIKDGLTHVLFRRDPKNPDKVIRLEADLGISDGRWVVIESGVITGDEVVHHGIYELMLAGGNRPTGGHFHADGTFHEGANH